MKNTDENNNIKKNFLLLPGLLLLRYIAQSVDTWCFVFSSADTKRIYSSYFIKLSPLYARAHVFVLRRFLAASHAIGFAYSRRTSVFNRQSCTFIRNFSVERSRIIYHFPSLLLSLKIEVDLDHAIKDTPLW